MSEPGYVTTLALTPTHWVESDSRFTRMKPLPGSYADEVGSGFVSLGGPSAQVISAPDGKTLYTVDDEGSIWKQSLEGDIPSANIIGWFCAQLAIRTSGELYVLLQPGRTVRASSGADLLHDVVQITAGKEAIATTSHGDVKIQKELPEGTDWTTIQRPVESAEKLPYKIAAGGPNLFAIASSRRLLVYAGESHGWVDTGQRATDVVVDESGLPLVIDLDNNLMEADAVPSAESGWTPRWYKHSHQARLVAVSRTHIAQVEPQSVSEVIVTKRPQSAS